MSVFEVEKFVGVTVKVVGAVFLYKTYYGNLTILLGGQQNGQVFHLYTDKFLTAVDLFLVTPEGFVTHAIATDKLLGEVADIFFRIAAFPCLTPSLDEFHDLHGGLVLIAEGCQF